MSFESLSQVYGVLHEFLRRRVIISAGLGKHACDINEQSMAKSNAAYICYDDGCHLRKFCRNPVRRELSDTSKCLANYGGQDALCRSCRCLVS